MSVCRASRRRQAGVALITVLVILAIMTALVVRLGFAHQIWMRQVENNAVSARIWQVARAAELWLIPILEQDNNGFDGKTEFWAQALPSIPLEQGVLHGRIQDLQGRFNVNNLVGADGRPDGKALRQFRRLLQLLELDPEIADAVMDWLDADDTPAGAGGAEADYYGRQAPPYVPANGLIMDPAELRLIRGIDLSAWSRLEPHVSALPTLTPVNINTATPEVLAAVMPEWGDPREALARAVSWVERFGRQPYRNVDTFVSDALDTEVNETPPGLAVESQYFQASIRLDFDQARLATSVLYYRNGRRVIILEHRREYPG